MTDTILEGDCVICGTFTVNAHDLDGSNVCCGCHDRLWAEILNPNSTTWKQLQTSRDQMTETPIGGTPTIKTYFLACPFGYWGIGDTEEEALKNARSSGARKDAKTPVFEIVQTSDKPEPYVDPYGNTHHYGSYTKIAEYIKGVRKVPVLEAQPAPQQQPPRKRRKKHETVTADSAADDDVDLD